MEPVKTDPHVDETLSHNAVSPPPVELSNTETVGTGEPQLAEAPALDADELAAEAANKFKIQAQPATAAAVKPSKKVATSNMPLVAMCIVAVCFLALSGLAYYAYSKHN